MSIRVDSSPLIASSLIVSQYHGLGVPGADVPQTPTGGDTGSMMNESVTRPDDNAVEFRFEIASGPTGGASFTTLNEDGSYALTVPGDGVYTWTFNLWKDGTADAGNPFTGTATIGSAGGGSVPVFMHHYRMMKN